MLTDEAVMEWEASLPAWGVWIEISIESSLKEQKVVTPRMGSVD